MNNKNIILILCCTLTCFSLFPQNEKIADQRFNKSIQLGKLAFSKGDTKKTEIFFKNAFHRAQALDNGAAISDSAYNLAFFYYSINNYTLASEYISESEFENHLSGHDDFEILLLKSKILFKIKRPDEAKSIAEMLLKKNSIKLKSTDDYEKYFKILIALIHFSNTSNPSKDLPDYIQKSKKILPYIKNISLKAHFYKILSSYFEIQKEYKNALSSVLESITLYKSLNDGSNISEALFKCALIYQQLKDPENTCLYAYRAARSFSGEGDELKANIALALCTDYLSLISEELSQRILSIKTKLDKKTTSSD